MRKIAYIALLVVFGCVDRISFDTGIPEKQLVIYGEFSAFEKDHVLTITKTNDFGEAEDPVLNAMVKVVDGEGNCGLYYPADNGRYVLPKDDPFKGEVGGIYHVEITLENGQSFRSPPQELIKALPVEDVHYDLYFREEVTSANSLISKPYIKIMVDSKASGVNGEGAYLRWTVREEYSLTDLQCHPLDERVTCYFNVPIEVTNFPIFESVTTRQNELKNLQVFERDMSPDWQFNERHMFSVHQFTMSEDAYQYWEKVNIVSGQSGSIFDQQPAAIPGNIYSDDDASESVLGYFEVSGESVGRVYTLKESLQPLQIVSPCIDFFTNYRAEEDFCCFCWLLEADRIPRPEYWGDD